MSGEIPQNKACCVTHTISRSGLFPLLEKLLDNRNVLKVEYERSNGNFKVTVHYAIMDLAIQLAAVSASIEQAVAEANETASVRS